MRVELTDAFVRALKPPARGRIDLRDTLVPCLTLRITHNGTATWSVQARTRDGKRTRPSLGTWPVVGIRKARQQARLMLADIAHGGDPAADKRQARIERQARAALPTVAEALAAWRGHKAATWSPRYAAEVERLCGRFIEPVLGQRVLCETARTDWVGMIVKQRAKRPSTATWLYQIASAFLGHAEAHGLIPTFPLPRRGLSAIAPKGAARQRTLDDDELRQVWLASAQLAPKARCFARLLIMTACRVSEAAGIAAGELDLKGQTWTIPSERAKSRRAITLPLDALLLAELTAVSPEGETAPDYHLLGAFRGSGLQGISGVKRRLDRYAALETPWVLHDLRRSARTGLARLGVDAAHAEAALNHIGARSALERTYNVHRYETEIVAALTAWQRHVAGLVGETPTAGVEVISLRRA
jgi:integrase